MYEKWAGAIANEGGFANESVSDQAVAKGAAEGDKGG